MFNCETLALRTKNTFEIRNKTRTSKVGAISKAQKAQNIFFGKQLATFELFSFKKCRIVLNNVKGVPFGFINIHSVAKFRKKFPKKVAQCRKIQRRDPLGTPGFVGSLDKVKNERGDPLD